ncbi:RteC domain-containing protein [Mucilaginibacter segetis]|uniref:RteC domain-containing protein n=1 Tax=Mucilaginibacter segetis TaxID=2793071 RepID=A0A934PSC7_9SPHI|nr:RteC domain-containing protein [Mucilaginibacter segetis]MBK0378540.1 RteC domain-containing protein [Mucilaginibacter segetis]
MKNFAERLYTALENQLNEVIVHGGTQAEQLKESIRLCKKSMTKLKNYISTYAFGSREEEMEFFKMIKPRFYSKYIYFINVYNFLMHKPLGGANVLRDYINQELTALKSFFDHNHSFYQYYRAGSTEMDHTFFTRGDFDVHIELEDFEEDELYSTTHDYKLSKIMANEKFQDYLNRELIRLDTESPQVPEAVNEPELVWTFNKTDLVELIYALVALGVFNNGHIALRPVIDFFQRSFQVDLGSYYHKYTDITNRKKDKTVFLDKLKLALLRRIEESFEKDIPVQQRMQFK